MYLQKALSRKNCVKKLVFAGILKVNDENSRIRIHTKMSWILNTAQSKELTRGLPKFVHHFRF